MWLSPTRPGFESRCGNTFFASVVAGSGESGTKLPEATLHMFPWCSRLSRQSNTLEVTSSILVGNIFFFETNATKQKREDTHLTAQTLTDAERESKKKMFPRRDSNPGLVGESHVS